jgi:peroxiredoxin
MALTPSNMTALGTPAPGFALPDVVTDKIVSLSDFADRSALLVMFICKHCPYVIHLRSELARLGKDYADKNVGIVAISSNDAENYPDDSPENLKAMAVELGFNFPLLYDGSQSVAKDFAAACTPDFFLYDGTGKLAYRGQFDSTRPGSGTPDGRDLRAALDAVLAGRPVSPDQKPATGCNIKWKYGAQS